MSRPEIHTPRWIKQLRTYLITGMVALAPVVITLYILWKLFFTIDNWLSGLYARVPWLTIDGQPVPGLGFASVLLLILLTGVVAHNILGKHLLLAVEQQLLRVPVVRSLYNATKQMSQALVGNQRALFRQVVLVPFPTPGTYAIAFVTAEAAPEIRRKVDEDTVSVFVPTTPNPTSGYLLTVHTSDLIGLDMTVEEAVKLVISGGAVMPADRARAMESEPIAVHGRADAALAGATDGPATP